MTWLNSLFSFFFYQSHRVILFVVVSFQETQLHFYTNLYSLLSLYYIYISFKEQSSFSWYKETSIGEILVIGYQNAWLIIEVQVLHQMVRHKKKKRTQKSIFCHVCYFLILNFSSFFFFLSQQNKHKAGQDASWGHKEEEKRSSEVSEERHCWSPQKWPWHERFWKGKYFFLNLP